MKEKQIDEKHIIEAATFDFVFAPEHAAAAEADQLSPFIQEMLLPVVDEVFSEVSRHRGGYIDQLTIDLGRIKAEHFQESLKDHLRLRLKSALEAQLPLLHSSASAAKKTQALHAELGLLAFFLTKGYLPANRMLKKGRTVDEMLAAVLSTSGEAFARFLEKSKHQTQVLKRLIYQCSEAQVLQLVRFLAPTDAARLLTLAKKIKRVLARMPEATMAPSALNHKIWQTLITALLRERHGRFNEKHFINQVRQSLVAENQATDEQVLLALSALDLLAASDSGSMENMSQNTEEALALEALAQVKQLLLRGIREAKPALLRDIWPSVLRNHVSLLKRILVDCGCAIAVRRALSRKFSDEMLSEIVGVIDPASQAFVHEIVMRPALFVQIKNKEIENEDETKHQLWEFTLSYLIIERGSRFNKKAYLGSLLAQMAAHENARYSDLLQRLVFQLDEIAIDSTVKSEMRELLAALVTEHETGIAEAEPPVLESGISAKGLVLIQAYADYETLRRAFFERRNLEEAVSRPNDAALVLALESLTRIAPALLFRFFRTLQVEARSVAAYRHLFSAQTLLKFIEAFVSLRLHSAAGFAQNDFMQSIENNVSTQRNLRHYYAQIFFCLIQNVRIDFEAISEAVAGLSQGILAPEEEGFVARDPELERDILRTRVTEALVRGRPQAVQDFWPIFINKQAHWLRQALFVYGREAEVRKKLSKTFPDKMLLDIVCLVAPEAGEIVGEIVKRPQLFQGRAKSETGSEKENKTLLWEYTLGYLIAERGSHFNKKSYLRHLMTQMAAHRNIRYQDVVFSLMEGLETIEAVRASKSEMLHILRELSQEVDGRKNETKDETAETTQVFDVDAACRDLKLFLTQGLWPGSHPKLHAEASFLKMIDVLFQCHRESLFRLFKALQTGGVFSAGHAHLCPPEIFVRLIEICLLLENPNHVSVTSDFMQAMIKYAIRATHPPRFYQKVLHSLLKKRVIDFEAILSQEQREDMDETVLKAQESDLVQENDSDGFSKFESRDEIDQTLFSTSTPKKDVSAEDLLKADLIFIEKILRSASVLSAADSRRFLEKLESLLRSAPQILATFLKQGLEGCAFAVRLVSLVPEFLLAQILLLLKPQFFDPIIRISDLIASAACTPEIALRPDRITRSKWQFIFQYLFEEGRRFHRKPFVDLLTQCLARDAYYSDIADFRRILRTQLESHLIFGMNNEGLQLMEVLSQRDEATSPNLPSSEESVSTESPAYFDEVEAEWDEIIQVENAGLVIAAPYLQRFFSMLDLSEGSAFKNLEAAQHGVHLLQFLVNEKSDSPEYQLVLNKMLCGVKPGCAIERAIIVSAREKEGVEGLLKGMIANWKQIGETSLQGFRESFLQREGTLRRKGDDWQLQVAPKAFDILLDYIPWSFSLVKLPWMQHVIHVKWRPDEGA